MPNVNSEILQHKIECDAWRNMLINAAIGSGNNPENEDAVSNLPQAQLRMIYCMVNCICVP